MKTKLIISLLFYLFLLPSVSSITLNSGISMNTSISNSSATTSKTLLADKITVESTYIFFENLTYAPSEVYTTTITTASSNTSKNIGISILNLSKQIPTYGTILSFLAVAVGLVLLFSYIKNKRQY